MSINKIYTYLLLILFSITITYFLGDKGKNLLLIGGISLSPLMLIMAKPQTDRVFVLFTLYLALLAVSNYLHIENFRIESFVYTVCLILSFLFLRSSLGQGTIRLSIMIKFLKWIIYAYAIVLIAQQLCVLIGVKPINTYMIYENRWKLPSLSPEPSHLVIFVFFFMYTYLELREIILGRTYTLRDLTKEKWLCLSYFWLMLTTVSTTGFILAFMIFLKFLNKKNILAFSVLFGFASLAFVLLATGIESFDRIPTFLNAIVTLDFKTIDTADHSAAYRVVPFFTLIDNLSLTDLSAWIGHGMDAGKKMSQSYMVYNGAYIDSSYIDNDVNVGGTFASILDFGLIPFFVLCAAVYCTQSHVKDKKLIIIWIVFVFTQGINIQMFWLSLTLILTIDYFGQRYRLRRGIQIQRNLHTMQ